MMAEQRRSCWSLLYVFCCGKRSRDQTQTRLLLPWSSEGRGYAPYLDSVPISLLGSEEEELCFSDNSELETDACDL